jgi:hypothetical protein
LRVYYCEMRPMTDALQNTTNLFRHFTPLIVRFCTSVTFPWHYSNSNVVVSFSYDSQCS